MPSTSIISLILSLKYLILFPIVVLEGPLVMMVSGFLVKLGYLNFLYTYLVLVMGDLFGDILWYELGNVFGMRFVNKFGKFFNVAEQNILKVKKIFHKHSAKILFISKITMGFGFSLVTLITAGLVKIPIKKFIFWNALGELVWVAVLMSIGFYLGNFYLKVDSFLGKLGILSLIVIIFVVLVSITRYVRNKMPIDESL
ncbi:MAG: DedA family protein [Candidatus Pacebacteria bacterium]|nr:DedA family protein [Candidatus Paceibacterota bacterium]